MGAAASRAEAPCHHSLDSNHATVVEFVNCTQHTVHTYWINYENIEKRYFSLAPGASVQQPTYTAHPWTFAAPNAPPGTLCVVQNQTVFYPVPVSPGLPPPQARIECAGSLPWSPAHHPQFPPAFRSLAAALLCCYHRLSAQPPPADDPDASAAASDASEGLAPPPKQRQRRQGRWLALWCPPRTPASPPPDEGAAAAAAMPVGHSTVHHLGSLPQEVLLEVLAAAAPTIPLLAKPQLPYGVDPSEVPPEALRQLFAGWASNSSSAAAAAAGAAV